MKNLHVKVPVLSLVNELTAQDILDYAYEETLDEITAKHIEQHWQNKICNSAINEFTELLISWWPEIQRELTPQQLKKIQENINN